MSVSKKRVRPGQCERRIVGNIQKIRKRAGIFFGRKAFIHPVDMGEIGVANPVAFEIQLAPYGGQQPVQRIGVASPARPMRLAWPRR